MNEYWKWFFALKTYDKALVSAYSGWNKLSDIPVEDDARRSEVMMVLSDLLRES